MLSPFVVPAKPIRQVFGKFSAGFVAFQVDSLVLQGTPEPLDKNIVFETAFAVHADPHLPLFQHFGERFAGELAALVAVEYFGSAILVQRLLERLHTKSTLKRVGQAPA